MSRGISVKLNEDCTVFVIDVADEDDHQKKLGTRIEQLKALIATILISCSNILLINLIKFSVSVTKMNTSFINFLIT